jgi:hypothetical protein
MKTFLVAILAMLGFFKATAQVSLELSLDQDEFLPGESIRMAVKVANTSGQTLHLGADPSWLTFSMESSDGTVVVKNSEVPVVDPFDLESSQMATKHVNLQPYFQIGRPDRYKVTATMRIPVWGLTVNSAPVHFDIIDGGEVWSQDFGVVVPGQTMPDSRKYTLLKANYLRQQLRLYLRVGSSDGGTIYKVTALGPMVSFSMPEAQVGKYSHLHVLWQTGAQSFSYAVVDADGSIVSRDTYDDFNSHPRLVLNDSGEAVVRGGVRRLRPGEVPPVQTPPTAATTPTTPSPTPTPTSTSSVPASPR